jgi:hypothetical protein
VHCDVGKSKPVFSYSVACPLLLDLSHQFIFLVCVHRYFTKYTLWEDWKQVGVQFEPIAVSPFHYIFFLSSHPFAIVVFFITFSTVFFVYVDD